MTLDEPQKQNKAEKISALRKEIMRLEGFKVGPSAKSIKFGVTDIDENFPTAGLPMGATHEFCTFDHGGFAATVSFIAAIISKIEQSNGAIVWIERSKTLYPLGLAAFGIDANKLIFVEARREKDALNVIDEALRTEGLIAVVGEIAKADLDQTRRLQQAVEKSGNIGFLIRAMDKPADFSSACVTRWHVDYLPSEDQDGLPGLGQTRWLASLDKVRHHQPQKWEVEWLDGNFNLVRPKAVPEVIIAEPAKRVWR